ncbi:MAG: prepilin-type N-terminal cleavage/methylation domain-containing protein [Deltaproteobacteria bacterium]|nr:prepilin-type N-terminal cleavage/methylation domain-containing protein [Deltaproteobacteria bacterium]
MLSKFRSNRKGFTLIELMIVVAILAILSVVAVPAFIKYMRKAKTAEAVDMLDKIYKGAVDYFTTPRVLADSAGQTFAPCEFPTSHVAVYPYGGSCCELAVATTGDNRCPADPAAWDGATWSALKFEMTDAHYFQYLFDATGTDGDAQFTAHAQADLDCDTNFSTFQRYGKGEAVEHLTNKLGGECRVSQGAALYTFNEVE